MKVKSLSRVRLLVTPWTAAYQAPLSMDFPGKSTGVGCHCVLRGCALIMVLYLLLSTFYVPGTILGTILGYQLTSKTPDLMEPSMRRQKLITLTNQFTICLLEIYDMEKNQTG